jgi:hypothetical protein
MISILQQCIAMEDARVWIIFTTENRLSTWRGFFRANKQVTAGGDVVSFCRQPITHCLEMITKCEPRD